MMKRVKRLTYTQIIALGYLAVIAAGTLLLLLPAAGRDGSSPGFIKSFFTATSATCVTGLVLADTHTQWSLFGQIVILLLIQTGGLGFMTVIAMFSFMFRRKIGLRERGLLRESINSLYIGGVIRLIKKILLGTLIFEGAGAILLATSFIPKMGFFEGVYNSVFHSVSAFCNAGFDIMGKYGEGSSLTTFSGDPVVMLTIIALIIIGGIGFFVWEDLSENKLHVRKYQLHTKIVLASTGILLVAGAALFFIFEDGGTLSDMPLVDKLINALFCSVTPRTAGFNAVETAALSPAGRILTIVLMFIGGSPGSTAGGIKTTTLVVILVFAWSALRKRKWENIFGRRLEADSLKKASSIVVLSLSFIIVSTLMICAVNPAMSAENVLFETTSAISTVGLSTSITGTLGGFSQLIIILLMYAGRVGSLSFALLFTDRSKPSAVQNPMERINIG